MTHPNYRDLREAAEAGDPEASFDLWLLLESADRSPFYPLSEAEFERELENMQRAQSTDGHILSVELIQARIADAIRHRKIYMVIPRADIEQREQWLEKASNAGYVRAQGTKLQRLFISSFSDPSTPVAQEAHQLVQSLEKAAVNGEWLELINLSSYYEAGRVVVPDPIKSFAYFAAYLEIERRMHPDLAKDYLAAGQSELTDRASRLSPVQLEQAETLKQELILSQQRSLG